MKRAVRILFLMVGMVCAISALAAPVVLVSEDGAPLPGNPIHSVRLSEDGAPLPGNPVQSVR